MKLSLLIIAFSSVAAAQDAREIVRHAIETDRRHEEQRRNHTFLQRNQVKEYDGSGKVKKSDDRTWDVTLLEGSPYRRLVMRNNQPISPDEQKAEEEKLQASIEVRRKETPEQRERRIAEWHRKQEKQREPLKEFLDAFDFHLAGQGPLNGTDVYIIDATPKPGYRPKQSSAAFFPKVKARFWIEKKDYNWVKLDMQTMDTVTFGGFLFRLAKGSHLVAEQTRVNDVWMPQMISVQIAGRILLLKGIHNEYLYTYSDYKRFQVDSHVVETSARP